MGLPDTQSSDIDNPPADKGSEIPYRFAREHNVLLTSIDSATGSNIATLSCPVLPPFSIITELQRFLNRTLNSTLSAERNSIICCARPTAEANPKPRRWLRILVKM